MSLASIRGGGHVVSAWNDNRNRITAVDELSIVAILLLAALVAYLRKQLGEEALWLLGIFASLLVFILLSAFLSSRRTLWRVMHDFSPAVMIPVIFNAVGPIIDRASPGRWDATFAALDTRVFGKSAVIWREVFSRPAWFTDLMYVAYAAYYVVPVALAVALYLRVSDGDFRRFVFTATLTFYVSYIGYFMFPTVGPRPALEAELLTIGGGSLSHGMRLFLNFAERNHTDAFPSGHTALALICLYFAPRASRTMFTIFLPVIAGIIFSTVYLYYHYIVDVVAGAAMAGGCVWLGPRLQALMEPREVMKWITVRLGMR